jgi:hypothetical protein
MITYVYCTFQKEGFHKWNGATEIPEVSYLANKHRHIFHYKVGVSVEHNDREVEFIMLKHQLEEFVDKWNKEDYGSCEAQASRIYGYLVYKYNNRKYFVEVSEDGENGSIMLS